MDESDKAIWLHKLNQLKQEAEDSREPFLRFIVGVVYLSFEQNKLRELHETLTHFAAEQARTSLKQLLSLDEQFDEDNQEASDRFVRDQLEMNKTDLEKFLYTDDKQDGHYPFDPNSDQDNNI